MDPENRSDVYMAFQYFHYNSKAGTLLARSNDNGRSYSFLSWIGPLAAEKAADGGASFEPAIGYVGNRTIVAVMRDAAGNRRTWQTYSIDMGASFSPPIDISEQIHGGIPNGVWQRARFTRKVTRTSSIRICSITLAVKADYGDLVCTVMGAVTLASRSSTGRTTMGVPGMGRSCSTVRCNPEQIPGMAISSAEATTLS